MATQIEDLSNNKKNHKYDWETYFNGQAWRLTEGVDIESIPRFSAAARQRGWQLRYSVRCQQNAPGTVDIQATPIERV